MKIHTVKTRLVNSYIIEEHGMLAVVDVAAGGAEEVAGYIETVLQRQIGVPSWESAQCPGTNLMSIARFGPGTSFTEVRGHPLHPGDALDGNGCEKTASTVLSRLRKWPVVDERAV